MTVADQHHQRNGTLASHASAFACSGLCVLPANRSGDEKRPAVPAWKKYQDRLPFPGEIRNWFQERPDDQCGSNSVCLVCGAVSGNLEMIDFDLAGVAYDEWAETVEAMQPGLLDRLVIETSPSGGMHVVYRCESRVGGNVKLATRFFEAGGPGEMVVGDRSYAARKIGDRWAASVTMIETRGEGGLFLCAPSPGYELVQGTLDHLPVITADERETLLGAAMVMDETPREVVGGATDSPSPVGVRPGDDFNARGEVAEILTRHGWRMVRDGENQHWCRPGKDRGTSATLKGGVFYVFTSNAAPFEPQKGYAPFAVRTLLDFGGDFSASAKALAAEGYGEKPRPTGGVDLSVFLSADDAGGISKPAAPMPVSDLVESKTTSKKQPDPLPPDLLRVPGFIGRVMDHCLATAPYPNQTLAFCGALVLQAFLAGRKVRDTADNRTNIYVLGLAYSAGGKDWPRKLNARILHAVNLTGCLGEQLASGEGLQDALQHTPSMLYQTDEFDAMLTAMNQSKDGRYESVMASLLTLYSSSNSVYPMRRKAGNPSPGVIDQPCLVMFGTAIPTTYYSSLSQRMLTNGLFARTLVIEAGPRGVGQEPGCIDPPEDLIETASYWASMNTASGLRTVGRTDDADRLIRSFRHEADIEYAVAEAAGDPVATTVWGRAAEHVRKLALIYAVSENHLAPKITDDGVLWASELVTHQVRRMLSMAGAFAAENEFDGFALKAMRLIAEAGGQAMPHSVLLKRMRLEAGRFRQIMETLIERNEVVAVTRETGGRTGIEYLLVKEGKEV